VALLGFASFAHAEGPPEEVITLAADNWCPYTCDSRSNEKPGFMIELARAAFKPYNITVKYRNISWARAIETARGGSIEGIVGAAHEDAPDFVFPSVLQGMSSKHFWVQKNSTWQYSSVSSLGLVRIGIAADYAYSKNFDLYVKLHQGDTRNIQSINSEDALSLNIRKLQAGLIDTMPEDKSVMDYYFATQGQSNPFKSAGLMTERDSLSSEFLYIAFSPANPRAKYYADILNRRIPEMSKDGDLKVILDKYHVDDWYRVSGK
jgi:polar amino acid transport system substrate-binding protein